tara:strand:- start:15 stop:1331 length:1317 start_codon:yes stop_codon:yes gene_type:complete
VSSKIVFAEQNHGHSKLLQKYKISKSEYSIYNDKIKFDKYDCIIDAIFGIGLSRNINSNIVDIFHNILSNKPYNHDISWNNKIISIDTPSGQFIDSTYSTTISIYPKYILELGFPKVGNYFHFPTPQKHILDIGFKKLKKFDFQIIDEHDIDNLIKPFYKDEKIHKHKKKVNIIAGSDKYPGAAILCSKAALQSGSGYVNLFVDTSNENTINLIKNNLPESIVESLNSIHDFDKEDTFVDIENLLIGPGINFNRSMNIDYDFYNFNDCVIDAGGLKNKELSEFPLKSILTPHMGEFQGLFKFKFYVNDPIDGKRYEYCGLNSGSNFDFKLFKKIQKKLLGRIIILKSFNTYIIDSDMIYIMDSGPSLLATAGTGDVLSGILVSLLSQGYSRLEASVLGTYLHAEAANYYMNNISKDGMTASDLIDCIPYAFNKLRKND